MDAMLGAQQMEDRFSLASARAASGTRVTQKSSQLRERGRESPLSITNAPASVMMRPMPLPPFPLGVGPGGGGDGGTGIEDGGGKRVHAA